MYRHLNTEDFFHITALYTAFQAVYGADYYVSGETHDFWEIVIVTEGEIGVTAGKDVFHLRRGQAILHEPNEFHNLWSERGREAGFVIFSFSAPHLTPPPFKIFEVRDLAEPFSILAEIESSLQMHKHWAEAVKEGCEQKAALAIKHLELFLLQTLHENKAQREQGHLPQSAKHYAEIVRFLESNLHRNLSVREIAEECRMGEVNLKKIFSRYAGMGVIAYFNHLKIRAAVTLLTQGATVREAAEQLGFLNQNYFCTVFKRVTGKPPKSFKG